ncbi:hypothetical protein SG26_02700 [Haloarcula sp. CBA1115]|uniref:hypothetical protein n=1 Tax=unclassified Haloarcula TaxID=2624677 RepID=UPI0005955666|nr:MULTISPECIES: hypothetical protein [unclassified Haloarcula]AJF24699.1 hypothetical protein SG26_02700 [Haloarcula sp. CBA1115]
MTKKKITVDNPEQLAEIVALARKASDTDNPVTLLAEALEAHIDEVSENNSRVSEAQERTRERLGLEDGDTSVAETSEHSRPTDTADDDVAAKQEELREKHFN